jgi:hypothetical protein
MRWILIACLAVGFFTASSVQAATPVMHVPVVPFKTILLQPAIDKDVISDTRELHTSVASFNRQYRAWRTIRTSA